jgi:predicted AlkP superfamily phosphohydrolase/phosphomutase/tetratricopeptide (TPR) repeat protein
VTRSESGRKILLVGWDAADWKIIQPLLDRGELPVLEKIVNGGVMGNLSSIRPMLSPMLWNSIATGKRPFKHGVHGFTEVDYELNQVVPVSSATRKCKAIWNILNRRGLKTHVVGWFATHPAEPLEGACVSDRFASPAPQQLGAEWKLPKDAIYPARLEAELADLRMRPEELPGDMLRMFVRDAAKINQAHDKRLHQLAIHLAECFSVHAAATYLLEHEPWDFAAVYYRAIDWLCHHFMEFHPPRRAGIYEPEFELYRDVVNGAYRLHDLMLGRLLQLAGEEATVILVSDHGFASDHRRPIVTPDVPAGIAAWHRLNGILAMHGKGLREDELIHGANLLDIAPTILALFGLPIGSDMDGRVLVEAFSETPKIDHIEGWDQVYDGTCTEAPRPRRSPDEEKELIRQFVEIGYINDPGDDPQEAIKSTERENRWALAQSYLSAARYTDALPLLESVYEEWPERWDFCSELALCQLNLGLIDEAHETVSGIIEDQKSPGALLLRANIEYRRKSFAEGLAYLTQAEALDSASAGLQNQIGLARLRLHQPELAEVAFRKAIENDADDAYAYLGVAFCRLRARQYEEAADYALQALSLRFDLSLAHHNLGVALARLGDTARAIEAFEACLRYQPGWTAAHRYLAVMHSRQGEAEKAQRHHDYLKGRVARRKKWIAFLETMRREITERARERAEARRKLRARAPQTDVQPKRTAEPMEFLIVSGLPRSGTSLMMQILEAGDLAIMRDNSRPADESNPRGYFEWQEIKQLTKNPFVIEKANGRAVKVISMLLPSLPRKHRFRVIFMNRDIAEIAASQQKLRRRLSGQDKTGGTRAVASQDQSADSAAPSKLVLQNHRDRMLQLLRDTENVELLEIDYAQLLDSPNELLARIVDFAKIDPTQIDKMAAAIDRKLRHFNVVAAAVAGGRT